MQTKKIKETMEIDKEQVIKYLTDLAENKDAFNKSEGYEDSDELHRSIDDVGAVKRTIRVLGRLKQENKKYIDVEVYKYNKPKITKKMKEAESFVDSYTREKSEIPSYQQIGDYFNITKAAAYQRLKHCRNKLVNQPDRTI